MNKVVSDGGLLFIENYALCGLFENNFDADHYENLTYYHKKGRS